MAITFILSIPTTWCPTIARLLLRRRITECLLSPVSRPIACLPASFIRKKAKRSGSGSWPTSPGSLQESSLVIVIPAVDIKDGRCVRLYQGEMDKETIYFENPIDAARHWVSEGATFIHIVDLNGAIEGRPVHTHEVGAICKQAGPLVELGGGLRLLEAVEAALSLGVSRGGLGTGAP